MTDLVSPYLNRPLRTEAQARVVQLETINAALLEALEDLAQAIYDPTFDANHASLIKARAAIARAKEG